MNVPHGSLESVKCWQFATSRQCLELLQLNPLKDHYSNSLSLPSVILAFLFTRQCINKTIVLFSSSSSSSSRSSSNSSSSSSSSSSNCIRETAWRHNQKETGRSRMYLNNGWSPAAVRFGSVMTSGSLHVTAVPRLVMLTWPMLWRRLAYNTALPSSKAQTIKFKKKNW